MYQNFAEKIKSQIEVREPYFALSDLRVEEDTVHARLPQEQPMENEVGLIAAAEAGRHLAILGSCALANSNPLKEKHYYIAHKAHFKASNFDSLSESNLRAEAQTLQLNKKRGIALTTLYHQSEPYVEIEVEYHVIREKVFLKLYQDRSIPSSERHGNPYAKSIPLQDICISGKSLSANLGKLTAESCSGHFEHIPCMPVAVLMYSLGRSASVLLSNFCQKETSYRVVDAIIQAENFAFVGDLVLIDVELKSELQKRFSFHCLARSESGKCFGEMDLTLEIVEE